MKVNIIKKLFMMIIILVLLTLHAHAYQVFPVTIDNSGNVTFSVEVENAQKVSLAGNFNSWNKDKNLLGKDELGIFTIILKLLPGKYEYKIVINDKEWVPEENIKFEIRKEEDAFKIIGGEPALKIMNKRNNIKANDKLFIKGLYKMIIVNKVYEKKDDLKFKNIENRHILDLMPEVYPNENSSAEFYIGIDSSKANYLSFWKGRINLYTDKTVLILYNNMRIIEFNDPLHSFDRWFYSSKYPLFDFPIILYDESTEKTGSGINTRGAVFKYDTFIKFYGFYTRYEFKNDNLIGIRISKDMESIVIGYNSITRKFKYSDREYINPQSSNSVESPYKDNNYYQVDTDLLYIRSQDVFELKNGIEIKIIAAGFLNIFSEYLYKSKDGGFFAKTTTSDGKDLPDDYKNYSTSYAKNIYFYELPYTGNEFIFGIQLLVTDFFQQECSYSYDNIIYKSINTFDIRKTIPQKNKIRSVSKVSFKIADTAFIIKNEIEFVFADPDTKGYKYGMLFDRHNFYNKEIEEAYKVIHIKTGISLKPSSFITINNKLNYNKYFQRDIYFNTDNKWQSDTFENYINCQYRMDIHWMLTPGVRMKNYSFGKYLEETEFIRYRRMYFNLFVQLKYSIYKNFHIALEYGLNPESDEFHQDGMMYYMNDKLNDNFPFFKTAEDNVRKQNFISLKGEFKF